MRKRASVLSKKQPVVNLSIITLSQLRTQRDTLNAVCSSPLSLFGVGVAEVVSAPASFVCWVFPLTQGILCSVFVDAIHSSPLEWQIWAKNQSQRLWMFYLGQKKKTT